MYYSPWRVRIWCSDTKGLLCKAECTGAGSVSLTMPFNQHCGAIYLKLELYSAVEIASDIVTEHGCQVCLLSPTAGSVDSPHAPMCWPRTARASASEQPRVRSVLFNTLNRFRYRNLFTGRGKMRVNTVVSFDCNENTFRYRMFWNKRENKHIIVGSQPCYSWNGTATSSSLA